MWQVVSAIALLQSDCDLQAAARYVEAIAAEVT
jgi:hypothetical protein